MRPVDYLRWGAFTLLNTDIAAFLRAQALKDGRIGMAFWIQTAILMRVIQRCVTDLVKHFLSNEQLYRLKRRVYQPEVTGKDSEGTPNG